MNPAHTFVQPISEFSEEVIQVNRTSKKTTGGNKIGFAVLVVVGNKKGKVVAKKKVKGLDFKTLIEILETFYPASLGYQIYIKEKS